MGESFSSVDAGEKDFRATGPLRSIGWAVLYAKEVAIWL